MLHFTRTIGLLLLGAVTASSALALNPAREVEPNNAPAFATPITINDGPVRGQLSSGGDIDYYTFTMATDGVVRFLIGIDADCQNATPIDSNVNASVVDGAGNVITGRELTGCAAGTMTILDANLLAGTYYLKFNIFDPTKLLTQDDYVITPLTKATSTTAAVREAEPNNTPSTATAIALNAGEVRGQLAGSFDLDYYTFQSTGGIVRFIIGLDSDCAGDVTPPLPSNIRVSIRAADGTLINIQDLVACTSGTTRAAVTTIEANTTAGIYYLLFQPASSADPTTKDYVIYPFGLYDPQQNKCALDLDGNGVVDALTDGIMLMRALFGLSGAAVTNGALGAGATRTTWPEIRLYLNSECGGNFP